LSESCLSLRLGNRINLHDPVLIEQLDPVTVDHRDEQRRRTLIIHS
jgi:hypothetical protein